MSGKKKRSSAGTQLVGKARAGKAAASVTHAKSHETTSLRRVKSGVARSSTVVKNSTASQTFLHRRRAQLHPKSKSKPRYIERSKNDVTDDEIQVLFATLSFPRLVKALKARVATENGREILELLALQGDRDKPHIEQASGPSLSTGEAGEMLGKTPETIRTYISNNKLAGYNAANDHTKIRLPRWQFDGKEVYDWVPRLIDALGENGWPLIDFVTVERQSLGKNYLDLLRAGEVEEVIAAARRANPD